MATFLLFLRHYPDTLKKCKTVPVPLFRSLWSRPFVLQMRDRPREEPELPKGTQPAFSSSPGSWCLYLSASLAQDWLLFPTEHRLGLLKVGL